MNINPEKDLNALKYLGDGVYIGIDKITGEFWIYTNNGLQVTNCILLEDIVVFELLKYFEESRIK